MDTNQIERALSDFLTPLIRTSFTDAEAWSQVVDAVLTTPAGFDEDWRPNVVLLESSAYQDLTAQKLASAISKTGSEGGYAILADEQSEREANAGLEITVVYVDLTTGQGDWLRCAAQSVTIIEVNLSNGNLDLGDLLGAAGDDGVYRFHES